MKEERQARLGMKQTGDALRAASGGRCCLDFGQVEEDEL